MFVCYVLLQVRKFHVAKLHPHDDVTVRHGVSSHRPETDILMTSSVHSGRAGQSAAGRRAQTEKPQHQQQYHQYQQHQYHHHHQYQQQRANVRMVKPTVWRPCSCQCDSSPSPTGNSLSAAVHKPEVETSGSRDNGGVKPAIEMTRQQVLHVYVLNDRHTGSDVRGHVTRRRAVSATPAESRRLHNNDTCVTATPHQMMTSRGNNQDVPRSSSSSRRQAQQTMTSENVDAVCQQRSASRRQIQQYQTQGRSVRGPDTSPAAQMTVCCTAGASTASSLPRQPALSQHQYHRHHPDVRNASLDRRTSSAASSHDVNKMSLARTQTTTLDRNFRLPRVKLCGSLDREHRARSSRTSGQRLNHSSDDTVNSRCQNDDFCVNKALSSSAVRGDSGSSSSSSSGSSLALTDRFDDTQNHQHSTMTSHTRHNTLLDDQRQRVTRYQRQRHGVTSTSLQPTEHRLPVNYRSHRPRFQDHDWTSVSRLVDQTALVKDRVASAALDDDDDDDDVDWSRWRWVKRQIHLPVIRRSVLLTPADTRQQRRSRDDDDDDDGGGGGGGVGGDISHTAERDFVSSQTDPDNVCFTQRCHSGRLLPSTDLVYTTRTDPNVSVQFTTDNNGNILKVCIHQLIHAPH